MAGEAKPANWGKSLIGQREASVALMILLLFVYLGFRNEFFLTPRNLLNVGRQASVVAIVALGLTNGANAGQAIGEYFGGVVEHAPHLMHGKTSAIHHHGEGVFAGLPSPLEATRYHSLIIKRETLPDTLKITAEADDGTIQGVLHRAYPVEPHRFG